MTLLPAIRAVRWAIDAPYLRAIVAIARAGQGNLSEAAARRDARMQRRQAAGVTGPEALPGTYTTTMHGDCAVISIDGPIFRRANMFTEISGGASTEYLAHDIATALAADRVRSILLLIDSPGGEAKGIHELAAQIFAGRSQKPIHAYTDGDCCSGAYWLAAAAEQITLDASALIGSVGVVLTVDDPAHALNDDGTIEIVSSMSDLKRPDPHTDDGRAALQTLVDDLGWLFVDRVAEYRGMTRETVTAARGGVMVGQRAVDATFADALGSFATALADCQQAGTHATPRGGALAHGLLSVDIRQDPALPIAHHGTLITAPAGSGAQLRIEEEPMPQTPEDTALLEAQLAAPTPLEARIDALQAALDDQRQTIVAQQETIERLTADLAQVRGDAAAAVRGVQSRLAVLEGDAPAIAGGYRASTQAPQETNKELLAQAPAARDPLDDFLS